MKQFNFSLEKILVYREQILELEKNNLSIELLKEIEIEQKIAKIDRSIDKQTSEIQRKLQAGTNILDIQKNKFQIEALNTERKQKEKELLVQLDIVEKQRGVVVHANQNFTVLDKFKEQKREEYEYEAAKEQADIIEEVISGRLHASTTQPTGG